MTWLPIRTRITLTSVILTLPASWARAVFRKGTVAAAGIAAAPRVLKNVRRSIIVPYSDAEGRSRGPRKLRSSLQYTRLNRSCDAIPSPFRADAKHRRPRMGQSLWPDWRKADE